MQVSSSKEIDNIIFSYRDTKDDNSRDLLIAHVLHRASIFLTGLRYYGSDLHDDLEDIKHSVLVEVLTCLNKKNGLFTANNPSNYLNSIIDNTVKLYLKKKWRYEKPLTSIDGILDFPDSNIAFHVIYFVKLIQQYEPNIYFEKRKSLINHIVKELKIDPYLKIPVKMGYELMKEHKIGYCSFHFILSYYIQDIKVYLEKQFTGAYTW